MANDWGSSTGFTYTLAFVEEGEAIRPTSASSCPMAMAPSSWSARHCGWVREDWSARPLTWTTPTEGCHF